MFDTSKHLEDHCWCLWATLTSWKRTNGSACKEMTEDFIAVVVFHLNISSRDFRHFAEFLLLSGNCRSSETTMMTHFLERIFNICIRMFQSRLGQFQKHAQVRQTSFYGSIVGFFFSLFSSAVYLSRETELKIDSVIYFYSARWRPSSAVLLIQSLHCLIEIIRTRAAVERKMASKQMKAAHFSHTHTHTHYESRASWLKPIESSRLRL